MLTLTRQTGESLKIGEALVKIYRISGQRVWLSIDAPREVRIVRDDAKNTLPPIREESDYLVASVRQALRQLGAIAYMRGIPPDKADGTNSFLENAICILQKALEEHQRKRPGTSR